MDVDLDKKLELVTGYKANKYKFAEEIVKNKALFEPLIAACLQNSNKTAAKAYRILELVCIQRLDYLYPYLDLFCTTIKKLNIESALRPASKICMLLVSTNANKTNSFLTENQKQQIAENCFDWLIEENKVATKCYSIRSLYFLGTNTDWIHPELKIILEKDYNHQSAAYKAVSREILKKIK